MQKIGFGGGCHWCTEAIFNALNGVSRVEQGWICSSVVEGSTDSEAVIVHFNENKISLSRLIEVHLLTHSSTSRHSFRNKYRSAIYNFTHEQGKTAQDILIQKQKLFEKQIITKVYIFKSFTLNQEKYLNYYQKNKDKPFCQTYIEPKLKLLLQKFSEEVKGSF
ncbi:Peptide methionine sulfoxide reductase MsrA [hydrothermal vent metagenome]|uniref:peptide-methionine (S)-S-oxide reductase n=1 Tax=hydrothermal vent metagenome TaxID=652676 RepID=A0A1W1CUQ1_9ZZZZ